MIRLFSMFYDVHRDHPEGKKGINTVIKVKVNHYLYDIEKIRNISYIKKFIWQIPLNDEKMELYLIRRMWGLISPLLRLKCVMHYYRLYTSEVDE